ncbi:MAG: PEGA domain-containing protein [Verrucomicrobia bacterium]|nr:PEGA domain-containing protein [Verrucomicrobiota bacterium]
MMKIRSSGSDLQQFYTIWIGFFALLSVADSAEVVLTSDPPGSVISVAGKEAGVTPLTLDLPTGQPVEVASRFGPLGLLVHTLTPDDNQVIAYQFKHEYGTIVVTCDRADAALVIDGAGYGHPPAVILVSPGPHKLFVTASNAPDKTREVEVVSGQRASVEMDFSAGSPETTKTNVSPQSTPSPSPESSPSPLPKGRGSKPPSPERTRAVWEEPPPLIPAASEPANPAPSAAPLPKGKPLAKPDEKISARLALVSESGNTGKRKAAPSPSPTATADQGKARSELQSRWKGKEEELKLEKEQIENGIKNSTGAVREQWKYRMAVWEEKMKAATQGELAAEAARK